MTNEQNEFRGVMESVIGRYVPTKFDLYRISDFFFQIALDVLKDSDVSKVKEVTPDFDEAEKKDFYRAFRDMSVFMSQKVLIQTLNDAHKKIKSIIPVCEVSSSGGNSSFIRGSQNVYTTNEAEFDIDTSNIPKVNIRMIKSAVEADIKAEREKQRQISSDFEAEIDLSQVNRPQGNDLSSKYASPEGLLSDTSELSDGVYERAPEVDKDLDY